MVAKANEFEDLKPVFVNVGKQNVGVYRANGKFYAYLNECAHQGGPACEGGVMKRVKASIAANGGFEEYVSENDYVIACPWHGVEYSMETGEFDQDPQLKLKSFPVRLKGGDVYLDL